MTGETHSVWEFGAMAEAEECVEKEFSRKWVR